MKAYETLSGNTPLIRIDYRLGGRPGAVYAKLESFNLSGSIKDRVAARIVARAEETGALVPGQPIVEVTSGNTGIAFAAPGAPAVTGDVRRAAASGERRRRRL